MAFVRAFFAVLASIVTLIAVVAIKRGVEGHFWEMVRQAERDQAGSVLD